MDAYKTHGAFSWAELMTSDPKAATDFYAKLFGWAIKNMDMGTGPYHVVNVGESGVGGIMGFPPGAQGMPPAWGCYVTVNDVDETARQAVALGGKIVMPGMDIPGVGRMAVIADPQGATLNIITYASA